MKTYRFDVKVVGFITVEVKAKSKKKANERALDMAEKFTTSTAKIDDLQCVRLETSLLDIDGEKA